MRQLIQQSRFIFNLFLTILVVSLFIISGCSVFNGGSSKDASDNKQVIVDYGNYSFAYIKPFWVTRISKNNFNYDFHARYTPYELEYINISGNISSFFPSNNTYISFYPYEDMGKLNLAVGELGFVLADAFVIIQGSVFNPKFACSTSNRPDVCKYNDTNGNLILPKNCSDKNNTIIFINSNTTEIIANSTCIKLYSPKEDSIKVAERLIYYMLGVMNE